MYRLTTQVLRTVLSFNATLNQLIWQKRKITTKQFDWYTLCFFGNQHYLLVIQVFR